MSMRLARRVQDIQPFYVMEVAKMASELERTALCDPAQGGRPMIYLNIGEPAETASQRVQMAAQAVIQQGRTAYTAAVGLAELRTAISRWYARRWQLDIHPERIIITAGASAALQLAALALVEEGDEVLLPDPSYPCNRHFVSAAGASAVLVPCDAAQRYQLSSADVQAHWGPRTRGVLLASPSNPTGTSIEPQELSRIVQAVRERGGFSIIDEIYLGLSYEERFGQTALALGDDVISVNSFSKYFGMTGWRLGWLVVPQELAQPLEKLASNLYICASSVAQRAALACFEEDSLAEYERRRTEYARRRDFIVPALKRLGLNVPVEPDGAFYVWADVRGQPLNSWDLCMSLMDRAQVVLTPGKDFGPYCADSHLRLSFATSMNKLEEAVRRLEAVL